MKLKLIPKLKEYGNPIRKLFHYGRKDLEMVYKKMGNKLLAAEVLGDVISLYEIAEDCTLYIKITGQEDSESAYCLCYNMENNLNKAY